jgi:hypothetical protein
MFAIDAQHQLALVQTFSFFTLIVSMKYRDRVTVKLSIFRPIANCNLFLFAIVSFIFKSIHTSIRSLAVILFCILFMLI